MFPNWLKGAKHVSFLPHKKINKRCTITLPTTDECCPLPCSSGTKHPNPHPSHPTMGVITLWPPLIPLNNTLMDNLLDGEIPPPRQITATGRLGLDLKWRQDSCYSSHLHFVCTHRCHELSTKQQKQPHEKHVSLTHHPPSQAKNVSGIYVVNLI